MLMLVLANSYLLLFAFWEAVGLCSYLLVGFWFHRPDANNAAMKAFWTTRVGDIGFGLGTMLVWTTFGTFTYTDVFSRLDDRFKAGTISHNLITVICLLLFCGAIGKSAQVPLQTWLPDAMLAPTPVSALIHAATMVTAGIYLVARSWPLFDLSPGRAMSLPSSALPRRFWAPRLASCNAILSVCSLTRRFRNSATCALRLASARTSRRSSIS
jgi:NADH-quinone oxidoreductase subunit L